MLGDPNGRARRRIVIRSRLVVWAQMATAVFLLAGCGGSSTPQPNATPILSAIFPAHATAGSAKFTLIVSGLQFVKNSAVDWNGQARTTTFNSDTGELSASISAADIAKPGTAEVTVVNPAPGGGTSGALTFFIDAPSNPAPAITALSPASAVVGSAFTLTVSDNGSGGSGFASVSGVNWNGQPRPTTFVSASTLTAQITAADTAAVGTAHVTVTTPAPGGGTSNSVAFPIKATGMSAEFPMVVSVNAVGHAASGPSYSAQMDVTGRFIAFISQAKDLLGGPGGNVFVRDTCIGADSGCAPRTLGVDLAADGNAPNGKALGWPAISANGRYVAFSSEATNLLGDAFTRGQQIFLRDTCLGPAAPSECTPHTFLVSANLNNIAGSGRSTLPSLSRDGRFVAFVSGATDLVADVGSGIAQNYIRDTCLGMAADCKPRTVLASADSAGVPGNAGSFRSAISADGRYVAFDSVATNLSEGTISDSAQVYLRDTCMGQTDSSGCVPSTVLVSRSERGSSGNAWSELPAISHDGRFVAFVSQATNLVENTRSGYLQILLRDTCLGATVAGDCVPSTTLVSADANGREGDSDSLMVSVSPTGRYVSFASFASNLAPGASGKVSHVYVRDTCFGASSGGECTPRSAMVSISADGTPGNLTSGGQVLAMPLSFDARFIAFFSLATNLASAGQTSGRGDVFLARNPLQ
jgi:Tol biopolymer transport system component